MQVHAEESACCVRPLYTLTIYLSLSLSHAQTDTPYTYIVIYLHSYLKIFVYKCVYKLKIISFCSLSKWHLQGQRVRGTEVSHCIYKSLQRGSTGHSLNLSEAGPTVEVSLNGVVDFLFHFFHFFFQYQRN